MTGTIAFLPPADGAYTYRLSGKFYPEDLGSGNPSNYITLQKSWLLIAATIWTVAKAFQSRNMAEDKRADMELLFKETKHDSIQQKLGAMKDEHGQITI